MSTQVDLGTVFKGSSSGKIVQAKGETVELKPDQVVIDIAYSGLCGSDLHFRKKGDMVLGHVIGSSLFNLLVIVGGISAGVFTPTESAAVAIFVAVFSRYRQLVLLTLPPYFPGPISALSRLVPSRLSLHVCLNSSRESSSLLHSPCTPSHCVTPQSPLTRVCARKSASTLAYQRVFAPG